MATETKLSDKTTNELATTLTEFEVITNAHNQTEETSASDKFKQRLERFGTVAPEARKISRALRFGTSHEAVDSTAKKRRLERFGALPHSAEDEQQKKRKRADRFHLTNPTGEEAKKKRIDRFGIATLPSTTKESKSTSNIPIVSDAIQSRARRFGAISQAAKANALNAKKLERTERFKPQTNA